jgi:hypothetical protein
MGRSFNHQFMPTWSEDAGSLKAEGATVFALCHGRRCDSRTVDLDRVIAKHGPRFSFWDRRSTCPKPGCDGWVTFMAVRPGGSWQIQMNDAPPGAAEILHQRWKASLPADVRDKLPLAPMLQASGKYLVLACGDCGLGPIYAGAVQAAVWRGMSTDQVLETMRAQCRAGGCGLAADLVDRDQVPEDER